MSDLLTNREDPVHFKFYWLDENGNATSFRRKLGHVDDQNMVLDETEIPVISIASVSVRDSNILLAVTTENVEQPIAIFLIQLTSNKQAAGVKRRLDLSRSVIWAKNHRLELVEKGHDYLYRDATCENCGATLILSKMPQTPQVYCHFCDSLRTVEYRSDPIVNETEFRICDNCRMYSKPQKFTTFYFYFLLFIYGFSSDSSWKCGGCMRGEAWKMFFGNLLFVLGVPFAIYQLTRAYMGDAVTGKFKGLDKGNLKAAQGDVEGALAQYEAILEHVPYSAGVKYNLGIALLAKGDLEHAAQVFELALDDCANYTPAYGRLAELYQKLGETEKLEQLNEIWDVQPQDNLDVEVPLANEELNND